MNMVVLGLPKCRGHEEFSIALRHYQVLKETTEVILTEQYG